MPSLNFYVPKGRYGVMSPETLQDLSQQDRQSPRKLRTTETFGSWGATDGVILLVEKANGDLFCGNMAYNQGSKNEQTTGKQVGELLDAALGNAYRCEWTIIGPTNDTNSQVRKAVFSWFGVTSTTHDYSDTCGYFENDANYRITRVAGDVTERLTVEVNNGPFSIARPPAR